jgi:D-alanyl-D-alanine carboxypeptidase/D-alanyl-D-alanine-endopeptidase (penicillin-binding protein 4)
MISGLCLKSRTDSSSRFLNPFKRCGVSHFLILSAFVAVTHTLSYGSTIPPFNAELEAIIRRELPPNYSISIEVIARDTGRVLMEKDADLPLVPASTMKVATSAAALHVLHPEFTFLTEVLADNVRGTSVGNLYLKGYGDPYLVSEELFALTRSLREKGLREIRGSIVVDDSFFIPSKPLDENEKLGIRSYHAPYSALSLNFNSLKIVVLPASRVGQPARIIADPVSEYATIKGAVNTIKGNRPVEIEISRDTRPDGRETIHVEGSIGVRAAVKGRYVNVACPRLYTGDVFKEFLLREGIKVTGGVVAGTVPASAVSYLQFNSRPLASTIYWLNKFSNNFMAEQICMAMGAEVHGPPGTREKGLAVIRDFLLAKGVDASQFSLAEASGLSRNNRISAFALVKALRDTLDDFSCSPEFLASLGIAGADGTLKEKFADQKAKRRIRAKTGNLRGVNCLAGIGVAADGKVFIFAVLVNSQQKGTGFIDYGEKIIREVMDLPLGSR